jgi:hypothetical protein
MHISRTLRLLFCGFLLVHVSHTKVKLQGNNEMSTMVDNMGECFIHFSTFSDEDILITGTWTSLCKIVECRKQWCILDGKARAVSEKSFEFITEEEGKQVFDSDEADMRTDFALPS